MGQLKATLHTLLLILCCLPFLGYSAPILKMDLQDSEASLENYLEIYRDPTNKLKLSDILKPEIQQQFKPYNFVKDSDRYSLPKVTSWVKFTMQNPYNEDASLILKGWFNIGNLLLYEPDEKGQYSNGKPSQGFIYWSRLLSLNPHETKTFYLSSYSKKRSIFPLYLYPVGEYDRLKDEEFLAMGSFYGIALGLIFFNLFIFISTRDKNYLLYIITWTAFLIYKLLEVNVIPPYLWPHMSAQVNWAAYNFFIMVSLIFYLAYINSVVKAEVYAPRLHKISYYAYYVLVLNYIVYIISGGIEPFHFIYLFLLVAGITIPTIIVTIAFYEGFRPAKYLFVGVIALFVGGFLQILIEMLIPRFYLLKFIFPVASSIEMIFQSFALADRYNLIKESESIIKQEFIVSQDHFIQEQYRTIHSYERFLPKQVLPLLQKRNFVEVNLADHIETNFTILFSDIRGFTEMVEKMSPSDSFKFVNDYLTRMVPVITKQNGIIDKYIGDAIMALFPSADAALRAALGLFAELKKSSQSKDKPLRIGIGLHYGRVILGIIGSKDRMECTVISDAVNVTSRLESMNKIYGTSLLATDIALAKSETADDYHKRMLDKVRFYGKLETNTIYEIFGYKDLFIDKNILDIVGEFENGVQYYQQKQFLKAIACFKNCLKVHPEDKPSKLYIDRCNYYHIAELPEDWDGVYDFGKL